MQSSRWLKFCICAKHFQLNELPSHILLCVVLIRSRFKTLTLVTGQFPETSETTPETCYRIFFPHLFQLSHSSSSSSAYFFSLLSDQSAVSSFVILWRRTCDYLRISNSPGVLKKTSPVCVFCFLFLVADPSPCVPAADWFLFCKRCSGCQMVVGVQAALVMNMRLVQYDMLGAVYRAGWAPGLSLTGVQ